MVVACVCAEKREGIHCPRACGVNILTNSGHTRAQLLISDDHSSHYHVELDCGIEIKKAFHICKCIR